MNKNTKIWTISFTLLIGSLIFLGAFGDQLGFDVEIYKVMFFIFIPLSLVITIIYIFSEHGRLDHSFKKLERQLPPKKRYSSDTHEILAHPTKFQGLSLGLPALLMIEEDCISLRIVEEQRQEARVEKFSLNGTEILWVGSSGRPRDYYTWLLLKSELKKYYISISPQRQVSISWAKECQRKTAILYYILSDAGYKIGIDKTSRGFITSFIFIVSIIALFCMGINIIITGDFSSFPETMARVYGGVFIGVSIFVFYLILFSKKGPPSREEII